MSLRKMSLGSLWLGFILYAFLWAPPDRPDTLETIINLSTGNWEEINPLIVALFNLMGILPIMYSCILFIDGVGQKIKAFPFAIGSFAVGAFALLPYLALREPNPEFKGEMNLFLKIQDSRILGLLLTLGAGFLVGYGVLNGDWADFINQWQTSRFIHVMSLDFCFLSLLFPTLLGDDLKRRRINNPVFFWLISVIPLFGPLIYLSLRPPLNSSQSLISSTVN